MEMQFVLTISMKMRFLHILEMQFLHILEMQFLHILKMQFVQCLKKSKILCVKIISMILNLNLHALPAVKSKIEIRMMIKSNQNISLYPIHLFKCSNKMPRDHCTLSNPSSRFKILISSSNISLNDSSSLF